MNVNNRLNIRPSDDLWQTYQDVYFSAEELKIPGRGFFILTAWNPRGVKHQVRFNRVLQRKLLCALVGKNSWLLWGGDKTFHYREKSVAFTARLDEALKLSRRFGQLGLYRVEQGRLELLSSDGGCRQAIGPFRARFKKTRRLPMANQALK